MPRDQPRQHTPLPRAADASEGAVDCHLQRPEDPNPDQGHLAHGAINPRSAPSIFVQFFALFTFIFIALQYQQLIRGDATSGQTPPHGACAGSARWAVPQASRKFVASSPPDRRPTLSS
jgi:hypothetical protein